jgi:predicted AAA+ superfamily ATPase
MPFIHRQIEAEILSSLEQFPALALCGPRQSGKSTVLQHLLSKKYKYITFDDLAERERCKSDPKLFLSETGDYVILDEIQYVPEILSYIKIAIDRQRQRRGRFIVTGSQQFQLIKNLGDTLAGRICLLNLLPLSRAEISSFKTSPANTAAFAAACLRGSHPELIAYPKLDHDKWYSAYLRTYIERDVQGLHGVGSLLDFQKFMRLLAGRCAQPLNLSVIANDLGVAVSTIKNWVSILVASQVVFLLPPYYKNFGKRVTKNPKVYFTDCGLVTYLTGTKSRELVLYGPLAGPLFENYCIQELLKSYYAAGILPEISYYRAHQGLEIDLLIRANGKIVPFEIKLSKTPNKNMLQNIEKARKLSGEFDPKNGGIISLGDDTYKITQSDKVYSLPEFLKTAIKIEKQ